MKKAQIRNSSSSITEKSSATPTAVKNNRAKTDRHVNKGKGVRDLVKHPLFGPIIIILVVLLANFLYLIGGSNFNPNPINQNSGLMLSSKSRLVGGLDTIDPNDGFTTQSLGHLATTKLLHGHLPWWNYDEQVGAPLAGGMQSAALFVPFVFLLGLTNGVLFFHIMLQIIAGIGTYYLLKRLKCSEVVSVIGGSLFAVNGTFAWLGNAVINPIAFLPLLLLSIEIAFSYSKESKKRGWFLISAALALSLYSGFPETAYIGCLFAGLWILTPAIQIGKGARTLFIAKVIFGLFVGLLISLPILVAFIDYFPYANVGQHDAGGSTITLTAVGIPALIFPYIYGPIFEFWSYDRSGSLFSWWGSVGGYITSGLFFLALIGLKPKKNRILGIVIGAWVIIALARIFGFPGAPQIMNLIPGVSVTAFYRYAWPSLELAVIILACFGLDYLLYANKISRRFVLTCLGVVLATGVLLAFIAFRHEHSNFILGAPHHRLWLIASVVWGIGTVFVLASIAFIKNRYLRWLLPIIIVGDSLLMFAIPQFSTLRDAKIDLGPVKFLQANIANYRFYSMGPLAPNYSSYFDISSINTNNVPISKNWSQYVQTKLDTNANALIFTGTNQLDPNGVSPKQAFYNNVSAYEAVGVKYVITTPGFISEINVKQLDLTSVYKDQVAEIYTLPNPSPYFETIKGSCNLNTISKVELITNCKTGSTILRRELYMPGWTASIDHQAGNVYKTGPLFQALNVPPGKHQIIYNYLPPYIKWAFAGFCAGVLILMTVFIYPFNKIIPKSFRLY